MTVGERDVARSFHEQIQTIVFRNALFVTLDNAGNFFRELGLLRLRLEFIGIAQLVIGDTDNGDARHEQRKRDQARDDRHFGPQAKSNRTSAGYFLHLTLSTDYTDFSFNLRNLWMKPSGPKHSTAFDNRRSRDSSRAYRRVRCCHSTRAFALQHNSTKPLPAAGFPGRQRETSCADP